jgi:hypothetical protein
MTRAIRFRWILKGASIRNSKTLDDTSLPSKQRFGTPKGNGSPLPAFSSVQKRAINRAFSSAGDAGEDARIVL